MGNAASSPFDAGYDGDYYEERRGRSRARCDSRQSSRSRQPRPLPSRQSSYARSSQVRDLPPRRSSHATLTRVDSEQVVKTQASANHKLPSIMIKDAAECPTCGHDMKPGKASSVVLERPPLPTVQEAAPSAQQQQLLTAPTPRLPHGGSPALLRQPQRMTIGLDSSFCEDISRTFNIEWHDFRRWMRATTSGGKVLVRTAIPSFLSKASLETEFLVPGTLGEKSLPFTLVHIGKTWYIRGITGENLARIRASSSTKDVVIFQNLDVINNQKALTLQYVRTSEPGRYSALVLLIRDPDGYQERRRVLAKIKHGKQKRFGATKEKVMVMPRADAVFVMMVLLGLRRTGMDWVWHR